MRWWRNYLYSGISLKYSMSRIAKQPINIPESVSLAMKGQHITVTGKNGTLKRLVHDSINVSSGNNQLVFNVASDDAWPQAGTERTLIQNMVTGVETNFSKKLKLVGVGYRAGMKGKDLNLALGFSHNISFPVPEGIVIETPSQTEVVIIGMDKQQVGQVAAIIRGYRPPEPYKGKGVRYSDEIVRRKEVKKAK